MGLDPAHVSERLTNDYLAYLHSRFFFKQSSLNSQFRELLRHGTPLHRGPFLQVDSPFLAGASLRDLVAEGVLEERILSLPANALPPDRPLYLHQERAIRATAAGRNTIVATGTGSGKTETYLIPIIQSLLAEHAAGTLSRPGIRAVLVYPMNALANDQLKRVRALLAKSPELTFGRYIGDTPRERKYGLTRFRETWPDELDLPNELKSREEMWETPPHILVTNFAMLEYLLVRPQDATFFDSDTGEHLKYLVLDEVHSYDGAKGSEIAMLLRRMKTQSGLIKRGTLRCIGTSATLGGGPDDATAITEFAENLFDEPFRHDSHPSESSLLEAERVRFEAPRQVWGPMAPSMYAEFLSAALDTGRRGANRFRALLDDPRAGLPTSTREQVVAALDAAGAETAETGTAEGDPNMPAEAEWDWGGDADDDPAELSTPGAAVAPTHANISAALYALLHGEQRFVALRRAVLKGPKDFAKLSDRIFEDADSDRTGAFSALVSLASRASQNDGTPLIRGRYHFFLRSLEGGFICLADHGNDEPRLYLERRTTCSEHPDHRVFEIGTCRKCGEELLAGTLKRDGACFIMTDDEPDPDSPQSGSKPARCFLTLRRIAAQETNDDEVLGADSDALTAATKEAVSDVTLCIRCGVLGDGGDNWQCRCEDGGRPIEVLRVDARGNDLKVCPSCGTRASVRNVHQTLYTGPDEPVAEIATTLYQSLNRDYAAGNGEKRKLLTFSDSRQDAAYFAPYLEGLYGTGLRRHLLLQLLEDDTAPVAVPDLIARVSRHLQQKTWLGFKGTEAQCDDLALSWVVAEMVRSSKDRRTLEELGGLRFRLRDLGVPGPAPLTKAPWNLTPEESWALVQTLIDTLRFNGAVALDGRVAPDADVFLPGRADRKFAAQRSPDALRSTISWVPASDSSSNTRLDYLTRLIAKAEIDLPRTKAASFLRELFANYMAKQGAGFASAYLRRELSDAQGEALYQLVADGWEVIPAHVLDNVYRCTRCGTINYDSIHEVCPTYRCDGTLETLAPENRGSRANFYLDRYQSLAGVWLTAREHTAQLDSNTAAAFQNLFNEGGIDVLSCSTTFELGVDLGELEAVLMRNMPPTPANYAQRAGRAGRRQSTAALVVTYAQRRSHDLTHYNNPLRLICGQVRPPAFRLDNERIVLRHVYATALGAFFRSSPESFGKGQIADLLGDDDHDAEALTEFISFLRDRPEALAKQLKRIVPEPLHKTIGLADWSWADQLIDGSGHSLRSLQQEYDRDCEFYREAEQNASTKSQHKRAQLYKFVRQTIQRRHLLGMIANRGLFPKYGFPVDVVNLNINPEAARYLGGNTGTMQLDNVGLELNRDLKLAIAEYAPGSEVTAGGRVWSSAGVRVLPERRLPEVIYRECNVCSAVAIVPHEQTLDACTHCGEAYATKPRTYVKPEFGFVTDSNEPPPASTRKPGRQYASRMAFAQYVTDDEQSYVEISPGLEAADPRPGRLFSVNTGKSRMGFYLCQECGYAAPRSPNVKAPTGGHPRLRGGKCRAKLAWGVDIGHDFITDVLELRCWDEELTKHSEWQSVAYAIAEGSAAALGIRRDDLDVAVRTAPDGRASIFIYDSVPGGAGHVVRIRENVQLIVREALARVSDCHCEETTSCYECLRTYSNQRFHAHLARGTARVFLARTLGVADEVLRAADPNAEVQDELGLITDPILRVLVSGLVAEGTASPEIGYELTDDQGRVVALAEIAWPESKVAVAAADDVDAGAFESAGWRVFAAEAVAEAARSL